MKSKILAVFCSAAVLVAAFVVCNDAYANGDKTNFKYNVVDSPRRIAEPGIHASDTATGMNAERQTEINNSNPTEVVNPE